MTSGNINRLYQKLAKNLSEAKSELIFKNHYELLISVVLSAQSTDKGVNLATAKLFREANTPSKMGLLGEERIIELIRTIGLYRNKAKNIIGLSKVLLDKYESKVPKNLELLEQLPGVGRKTANVVLNIAYGFPTIAVDTHVFRVSNRTTIAPGKNVREVETILNERVPKKFLVYAHHWLILHGRYVCKARSPLCNKCLISDLCPSRL